MTNTSMKLTRRRSLQWGALFVGMRDLSCVRQHNSALGTPTDGEHLQKLVDVATVATTEARKRVQYTDSLLSRCVAVLVFPDVDAASLASREQNLTGVLCARTPASDTRSPALWAGPAFFQLSVAEASVPRSSGNFDLFLFIMNEPGLMNVLSYSVALGPGADLSVGQLTADSLKKKQQLDEDVYQEAVDAHGFVRCPINDWRVLSSALLNQLYYGTDAATAKAIVVEHRFAKPEAGPLLRSLQNEYVYQSQTSAMSEE